jgi:hypothetical protein
MLCNEISSTLQKRRFVELNIGNTALSRATVNFRMGFSRFPYI